MKIFLLLYGIVSVFKFIGNTIASLFRKKKKLELPSTSISLTWNTPCAKCGEKGGIHRFEGKKYCARCHARLYAEKKCGADTNKLNQD